jgi:1-acyl-sn-glycerol-3-phosphate acyltransferase
MHANDLVVQMKTMAENKIKLIEHLGVNERLADFRHWIGINFMKYTGWEVEGDFPDGDKFVLIASPHTSNWDLPYALAAAYVMNLEFSWMGKDSIFKKPFGGLMKWLGGIPIDRSVNSGVVEQMVQRFEKSDPLYLVVSPSGTRSKRDYWKSGFYWIAYEAKVPLVCAYLDYDRKKAGIGFSFIPTGNVVEDMARVRKFYDGIQGKHPELETIIKFKSEDTQSE